jgi:single-strand DNA-binding protein
MNKVFLIGRLTKDVDTRYTQGENAMAISRYTLAIDRKGKDAGTDFINCVAFGKQGEFAEKYLRKGMKIAVEGRIQTGSYEKDGRKVYTTDVVVEAHEFCESKGQSEERPRMSTDEDGFMNIPDFAEGELPF